MDRSRIAVALALVLAVAPGTAIAAPPTADAAPLAASEVDEAPEANAPPAAAPGTATCFSGEGHRFDIGTEGPRIVAVVHLSVLTDPLNPGGFGVELAGTALNRTVVTLQAGVRYDGVDAPGELLADPFAPFAYVFDYRLQLPMFASLDGAAEYESREPFSGPVERADC